MAGIEGFKIKNYRTLRDITLGKLWNMQNTEPLTPMTAVIGKNGVGKSTLFDAFGFLSDCLKGGVEEACDAHGRGGFERIRSQGHVGSIEFEIYYKEDGNARPITYELAIDLDSDGRPFVKQERLRQRRKGQSKGWPFSFLLLNEGEGVAWKGEAEGEQVEENQESFDLLNLIERLQKGESEEESRETEVVELSDKRKLGISTLGSLKQHPRISLFRKFIEGWYLSYFTPDANVVQFMEREHSRKFQSVLDSISKKIPGIHKISTEKSPDGRLLLRFNDRGFDDPFYAQQMSDGTLKVFAYLLLLEDPSPPPFICVEEPENGLYHKLLETLVQEFRAHATGLKGGSQIFVTTHQPYFVDALQPEEVWLLEKGQDGFSTIKRASKDPLVQNLVSQGLPLGGLWYSDYLDKR
jgi:predicted ATPase